MSAEENERTFAASAAQDGTAGAQGRSEPSDEPNRGIYSRRATTRLALAALLISVGHVVYAIWRDHLNGGEGLLSVFG